MALAYLAATNLICISYVATTDMYLFRSSANAFLAQYRRLHISCQICLRGYANVGIGNTHRQWPKGDSGCTTDCRTYLWHFAS
eukprot:5898609-Pleurochrysis_carterae.AAC.3